MNKGTVYIVHAVDTEGPLYEGLDATFQRIVEHYGVDLEANEENLQKIRNKEIALNGLEDKVFELAKEDMTGRHLGSWDQIDRMHEVVMSSEFRQKFRDSKGQPYVISWHCMDHVGFENNPRRRAMGFHAIFEHYKDLLANSEVSRDRLYWHFHPPSLSRDAHRQSCGFNINQLHNEIISRRIIDHNWIPSANRPGGHYETYDINVWLEAWIPFDVAHQFTDDPEDLARVHPIPGRFVDWRGAPTDWRIYQPDLYDHRKEGSLRRWISRCLNLKTRYNNINYKELASAFSVADAGESVLVGVTNHDHRDMVPEIEKFVQLVRKVSRDYPEVEFRWANVVEAFRVVLKLEKIPIVKFEFQLTEDMLRVKTDQKIWGTQPFLALRTHEGHYHRDDFINDKGNCWTYCFDVHSIQQRALSHIGVACNDTVGNAIVNVLEFDGNKKWKQTIWNDNDWIT